jgi:hypothetical protein
VTTPKLTPTQRGELLRRARQGASSRELAAEFGVSQSTAAKLVRSSLPPDPKADSIAKLQGLVDDESLPVAVRLQAAAALREIVSESQPAPEPAKVRPLHVPNPHAASLDGWENPFGDEAPKSAPVPKPVKTPEDLRAENIERANEQMRRAVETGNSAAISRLTEIFKRQGLYAPETAVPVSQKPALPMPPPDATWVRIRLLLLDCARVREDKQREAELVTELEAHNIDYPGKPKPEPVERDRPAALLPHIDEAGMARSAIRVRPVGPSHVTWEDFRDAF